MILDFTRGLVLADRCSFSKASKLSDMKAWIGDGSLQLLEDGPLEKTYALPLDELYAIQVVPQLCFEGDLLKKIVFKCQICEGEGQEYLQLTKCLKSEINRAPTEEKDNSCQWEFSWGRIQAFHNVPQKVRFGIELVWK